MGQCQGKSTSFRDATSEGVVFFPSSATPNHRGRRRRRRTPEPTPPFATPDTSWPSPFPAAAGSGAASPMPVGTAVGMSSPSPAWTPQRFFQNLRRPFPPPSPAKHIKAALARRQGRKAAAKVAKEIEEGEMEKAVVVEGAGAGEGGRRRRRRRRGRELDKRFGFGRNFGKKYELGKEVGKGHFGSTCFATVKKGVYKGHTVAVKIIPKVKMTTEIAIEDVRREVKILKALSGHKNLVKFYEACEDSTNVYIIMELCEGGELLDRILSRGGRYMEGDAKLIVTQILSVVGFCHLQGVVHRDLKPENFLFTSKEESAHMKLIDFGLSDFIRPDERLNDIVGSAYYVAPEVLHRSYGVEADMWSIGVITYILLCGSRPFWARTESGIFRAVLKADPIFDDLPWPSVSQEAKDFVKRLLNKDYRKRMTAAQALNHPWLRDDQRKLPLDIMIYKLVNSYLHATPLKCAALKALSKAITEEEILYLRLQYELLQPNPDGCVSLENFQRVLLQNATTAMQFAKVPDIINVLEPLSKRTLDFEEFCAAALSPHHLEAVEGWELIARTAFEYFEQDGNRVVTVEELAQEMNLTPGTYSIMQDWIRSSDGKLSFIGYTKYLHGVTIRNSNTRNL